MTVQLISIVGAQDWLLIEEGCSSNLTNLKKI